VISPRLLLVVVGLGVVGLLGWALRPPTSDLAAESHANKGGLAPQVVEAGSLEISPGLPLPGTGPLQVELHYLGSQKDAGLQVQRPGILQGMVYGPDGKGAPEVEIRIDGGPQDGKRVFTDKKGVYRMEGLIPGLHFFRLSGRAVAEAVRMQRILSQRPTKRDFFVGQSMAVRFLVRDHKNKELEGALVRTDMGLRSGTTHDKGLVELDQVPGGRRVVLDIRAAGHVPVRYEMNLFPALLQGDPIELPPLPQGGTVRGRVKSWPGGPLPTITMVPRATRLGAYQVVWEDWQDVRTDREGRFKLENVPLTHLLDVRAFHPEGISDPKVRAVQPSVSAAAHAEFVIRPAHAIVECQVRDSRGEPLQDAQLTLEAVHPDRVLAALYPGLADSPVGVRLPVPAQLRRVGTTNSQGVVRFAIGDHPQGTGHLLLTISAPGKRTERREVKTVGQSFEVVLQDLRRDGVLEFFRSDDGPIPPVEATLQGEPCGLDGLAEGFYRLVVQRGDRILLQNEGLWVQGRTRVDLRP